MQKLVKSFIVFVKLRGKCEKIVFSFKEEKIKR